MMLSLFIESPRIIMKARERQERQSASKVHIFMEIKVAIEEQIRMVEEDNALVE